MSTYKIYLEGDAPGVYPKGRPEKWSKEKLMSPPKFVTIVDPDIRENEKQTFIDEFLDKSKKDKKGEPLPEVYLRFHLRKDALEMLLKQKNCNGISISFGAKKYKFKQSKKEVTKVGTTLIICGIGNDMKDLDECHGKDIAIAGLEEPGFLQLQSSPCPPKLPCGSQVEQSLARSDYFQED